MIKHLLLDRDGVLNKKADDDYIKSKKEFIWIPAALDLLQYCFNHNIKTYVITNQQGVAKGIMSLENVENIHHHMQQGLASTLGGTINGFYICPHHKDDNCPCRKPKPGLIIKLLSDYPDINKNECLLIGDSDSDIQAAARAGIVSYKIGSDALGDHLDILLGLLSEK